MPARPETSSPAPLSNSDAALDRLCQTLVGWSEIALQSEIKAFQARYTLAFATIGFGGVMATLLAHDGMPIRGFLFLLCMAGFALLLNFQYCRQSQAWAKTRMELENFTQIVSYYGVHIWRKKPIMVKKPHEIWQDFYDDYAARPLDLLTWLFITITMCVMIMCAGAILSQYEIYCELDTNSGFSCRWSKSAGGDQGT